MPISLRGMKEQSMSFVSGYRRLREIRPGNAFVTTEVLTAAPAVSVGTFALECGFKFLICKTNNLGEVSQLNAELANSGGRRVSGRDRHSLKNLFNKLPHQIQVVFRGSYQSPSFAVTAFSGEQSFMMIYHDTRSADRTFDDELERISDSFVDFRYRYEFSLEVNLSFLDYMVVNLAKTLLADDTPLHPELSVRPNSDPVDGR